MMASVSVSLSSPAWLSFWEWVEFVSIIVIGVGCFGEGLSERFHFREKYKRLFWGMVVIGLGVELIAFTFSFLASNREIQQLRKANDELESKITTVSPLNQPVEHVTADVEIDLKGPDFIEWPQWGTPTVAWLHFLGTKEQMYQFGDFTILSADKCKRVSIMEGDAKKSHGYIMHFEQGFSLTRNFATAMPTVSHARDKIHGVMISAKFIPHNAEVAGGSVQVVINGWCSRRFEVLPQLAFTGHEGLTTNVGDTGFTLVATNEVAPDFPLPKGMWRSGDD